MLKLPFVVSSRLLIAGVVLMLLATRYSALAQTNTATGQQAVHQHQAPDDADAMSKKGGRQKADQQKGWKPLFDQATLKGWKVTNYGGEGEAKVTDSVLMLEQGVDLSGITTTRKDLPTRHYEVEFEARRTEGNDFFVGFTFPVEDSSCSLICGGWGGGICGISSIDMMDASENETTSFSSFNNGQWYKVKLKVDGDKIEAWMDGKSLLEVDLDDRKVDTRFEMELSKPMGFSSYQSTAEIRKARYRELRPADTKAPKAVPEKK